MRRRLNATLLDGIKETEVVRYVVVSHIPSFSLLADGWRLPKQRVAGSTPSVGERTREPTRLLHEPADIDEWAVILSTMICVILLWGAPRDVVNKPAFELMSNHIDIAAN